MWRIAILLGVVLAVIIPAGAATTHELPLHGCTLPGGTKALCVRLGVPENRAQPGGRSISLRVAVVPARERPRQPDPLVYVTGGPGGSAVDGAAGMMPVFEGINAHRDIVLVDQRGTGGSNALECPMPRGPVDTERAVRAYISACLGGLEADPRQYTTIPAMDDLAAVMKALGYKRVNLYGVSYGATAAQYVLARHPRLVRTAILDGATLLEPQLFHLAAGASSDGSYRHRGEEFLFVVDGALTIWVGEDERYTLRAGDALTFPSTLPHRWQNSSRQETRLLWINTPPTF